MMPDSWKGNRRSDIALVMRHSHRLIHLWAEGLRNGDVHPAHIALWGIALAFMILLQRKRPTEQSYIYLKFASHCAGLSESQAEMLSRLEDLFYRREGSEQTMLQVASRHGFQACSSLDDENCLLDAMVDQLNRLRKVTDAEELRQEAVSYLERYPQLTDGTELQTFVRDEQWDRYIICI